MEDQEEFERQLALEQEEERKKSEGYIYTDPNDGTVYEWDDAKQAWFPKVDEDFLAAYHANYGVYKPEEGAATSAPVMERPPPPKKKAKQTESTATVEESLMRVLTEAKQGVPVLEDGLDVDEETHKSGKRKKEKEEPTWFDMEDDKNTNVYVSGLPTENYTDENFVTLMSKYGIIMVEDEESDNPRKKIKLYRDAEGKLKGDGRCCYLKLESVHLAIQMLDGSRIEGGCIITVERAKFTMKGNFRPDLKKKKKKPNKKKKGAKNSNPQNKLLNWGPEGSLKKKRFEQVVIIKHSFHPDEFEEDAMLINEITDDLKEECSKFGEVKKVMIFDRHPDGVSSVKFADGDVADVCVEALNGRWFGGRQLSVSIWDGKTDYKIEETDKERDIRLAKWGEFLQDDEETSASKKKDIKTKVTSEEDVKTDVTWKEDGKTKVTSKDDMQANFTATEGVSGTATEGVSGTPNEDSNVTPNKDIVDDAQKDAVEEVDKTVPDVDKTVEDSEDMDTNVADTNVSIDERTAIDAVTATASVDNAVTQESNNDS